MIRLQMSAVLAVRDGYSGKPISQSTVRCYLDGQPFRPEYRQGGYLVFVNLSPGEHEVLLRGAYYQDEKIVLAQAAAGPEERSITLKPAPNYPFYSAVTQLAAVLCEKGKPVAGRLFWVAAKAKTEELKLAQDMAAAGSKSAKLYYRGSPEGRFPRNYLIVDGKKSEAILIEGEEAGEAVLHTPLQFEHKRGVALYPAQAYCTNEAGEILAFFREPVAVEVFDPEKKTLQACTLSQGRNEAELGKPPKEKE